MWPDCYSCWFNRRHSIPCTCCNVISLEQDWTPWRAKLHRIDVDATCFYLLWNFFTIIKIFSRRFKLDGYFKKNHKPIKYGQVLFCEAVKVDMANPKDTSFTNTISNTLSLITVLFEDLFEAITIHWDFSGEKEDPQPSISLLNKTNTFDGYDFKIDIITDEVNALQNELLMLFEGFCIFGYSEFYKYLLCISIEMNKTMYGNNEDIPDKLLDIFLLSRSGIRNQMNWWVGAPNPVFPQSYRTILNKREFNNHNSVTRPVQYSLFTMPTMSSIYDKPGAGWNRIDTDNYFKNYYKTNETGDWYNKKNIQQHNSLKRITLNW